MAEWISVKDRLPSENTDALVVVKHSYRRDIRTAFYNVWTRQWLVHPCNRETVTHWMPLPEPPKEEDKPDEAD